MSRFALAFGQAFGQGMGQGQQTAAQRVAAMLREAEMRRREQEFAQELGYRQSAAAEQARQFDARQALDENQFGLQRERQEFDVRRYEDDVAADERTRLADASIFDAMTRGDSGGDMSTLLQSGAFDAAALSPGMRTQVMQSMARRQQLEAKRPALQARLESLERKGFFEPGTGVRPQPEWLIENVEDAQAAGVAISPKVEAAYMEALAATGQDPAVRRFDEFAASPQFDQTVQDVMQLNPSLAGDRGRAEAFVRARRMGLVNQEDANISGRARGMGGRTLDDVLKELEAVKKLEEINPTERIMQIRESLTREAEEMLTAQSGQPVVTGAGTGEGGQSTMADPQRLERTAKEARALFEERAGRPATRADVEELIRIQDELLRVP